MHIFNMCICAFEGKSMNRIGKKIAWMSLSGMMIFSLPSCGKKDNAADETLIDPDYIIQEYETTTTDEGYTIINGFYRIKSNNGDKDTILYIPYIEISNKVFLIWRNFI